MLSDEVAASSIAVVKEISPMFAEIMTKIFGFTGCVLKVAGKLMKFAVVKGGGKAINHLQMLNPELKLSKLLKDEGNIIQVDGKIAFRDDETLNVLNEACRRYKIQYARGVDQEGNPILFIKEANKLKMEQVMNTLAQYAIKKETMVQVFGEENVKDIKFDQASAFSEEVKESLKKWKAHRKVVNEEKRGKVFKEAWEQTEFQNKEDIFSQNFSMEGQQADKEGIFLYNIKSHIKDTFGEQALDENLLHVQDRYILYFDEKDNLHYINLIDQSHQMMDAEKIMECMKQISGQDILENMNHKEIVQEMKNNMSLANQKLRGIYAQLESKYKDYGPDEKEYLFNCMAEQGLHPEMDISIFDGKGNDVYKMQALNEAHMQGLDMGKILSKNFSADQIYSLMQFEEICRETGGASQDVIDMVYDDTLSDIETAQIVRAYEENPLSQTEELRDVLEGVKQNQEKIDRLITGEKEQQSDVRESVNEKMLAAQMEKLEKQSDISFEPTIEGKGQEARFANPDYVDSSGGRWIKLENPDPETSDALQYYINEKHEVNIVQENKTADPFWKDKFAKGKPAYTDLNGQEWRTVKVSKNSRALVNKEGRLRLEKPLKQQAKNMPARTTEKGRKAPKLAKKMSNEKGR